MEYEKKVIIYVSKQDNKKWIEKFFARILI